MNNGRIAALFRLAAGLQAQDQPAVFRTTTDLVLMDVQVLNTRTRAPARAPRPTYRAGGPRRCALAEAATGATRVGAGNFGALGEMGARLRNADLRPGYRDGRGRHRTSAGHVGGGGCGVGGPVPGGVPVGLGSVVVTVGGGGYGV